MLRKHIQMYNLVVVPLSVLLVTLGDTLAWQWMVLEFLEWMNEWMNECLTTPQHEKQIGYWVSEKGNEVFLE